jgi:hypothetical protein
MRQTVKRILVWTIIGAAGMVHNCGCSGSFKYVPYVSKISGLNVSTEYISGWKVLETRGERGSYSHVVFIENKPGKEAKAFMSITATPGGGSLTLQSASDDLIQKRSRFNGFTVVARSAATLTGLEAQELVLTYQELDKLYSMDAKRITVKERIIVCKKGDILYSCIYKSPEQRFDEFNAAFSHMMATIAFKGE